MPALPANEANSYYPPTRADWRGWLEAHHATRQNVWVILYRKGSGKPSCTYDDIAEEALCFGWIDATPNKRDAESSYLLVARRKPTSNWSALNKTRVAKLEAAGMITEAGQAAIAAAKANGRWTALDNINQEPDDLLAALASVPDAARYWDAFPPSTRRGILEWISLAKTTATRTKRIDDTARLAGQNLRANQYRQPKSAGVSGALGSKEKPTTG